MHSVVFKLALAVILAAAIMFMLAASFSQVSESTNSSISNIELARRAGLNKSVEYLQR
jgi:hypothetical protein